METRGLILMWVKRQSGFLRYVMRRGRVKDLCLTGRVPGNRARRRQRKKNMYSIVKIIQRQQEKTHTVASLLHRTRDWEYEN